MFGDSWEVFGDTVLEVFGRFSYMGDGGGGVQRNITVTFLVVDIDM